MLYLVELYFHDFAEAHCVWLHIFRKSYGDLRAIYFFIDRPRERPCAKYSRSQKQLSAVVAVAGFSRGSCTAIDLHCSLTS